MAEAAAGSRDRKTDISRAKDPIEKNKSSEEMPEEIPEKMSLLARLAFIIGTLLLIAAALIIVLWAASKAGWIDLNQQMAKVPFLASILPSKSPEEIVVSGTTLLERENQKLLQELNTKRDEIQQLTTEKQVLEGYNKALEQKLALLQSGAPKKTDDETGQIDYKQLAAYFSEMKPANAEAILAKMDDETTLGILRAMDNDIAAKILAIMTPDRAALLSSKVTTEVATEQ